MKKLVVFALLVVTCVLLGKLAAVEPEFNSFPFTESFEGGTFPPSGWLNQADNADAYVAGDPAQTNPTVLNGSDGSNWAHYEASQDNVAKLYTPLLSFPEGNGFYRLSLSVYQTSELSYVGGHLVIYLQTGLNQWEPGFSQIAIASINIANRTGEPEGWQEFSYNLGFLAGTEKYICLVAEGSEKNVNIDNLRIYTSIPEFAVEPYNGETNVTQTPVFHWFYEQSTTTYAVYISTDNENFSLLGTTSDSWIFVNDLLPRNTTHYWYVQFRDDLGHFVDGPVNSFTTWAEPPVRPGEITEYPYLEDFQTEDENWGNAKAKQVPSEKLQQMEENLREKSILKEISKVLVRAERVLDGVDNYAMKFCANNFTMLMSPMFRLIEGTTYEIKFNERITEPLTSPDDQLVGVIYNAETDVIEYIFDSSDIENLAYSLRRYSFTPVETDNVHIVFMGTLSADYYLDNFRITIAGDDEVTAASTVSGGIANPDPAPIYNTLTGLPLDTDIHIENITGNPTVTASVSWNPPAQGQNSSGLSVVFSATPGNLAGASVTLVHNLGYTPGSISYRYLPNSFVTISNPNNGTWNTAQCTFTIPALKADGDFEVVVNAEAEDTLPVELSSFTATVNNSYYISIQWITESQTNHMGFNVFRSGINNLSTASLLNASLISTGISAGTQTTYTFNYQDEAMGSTYYLWLESIALNGESEIFGPLVATVGSNPNTPPVTPGITCLYNTIPNPFHHATTFHYALKDAQNVRIEIYNVKGQVIRSFSSYNKAAGEYFETWDGTDANGKDVASGIYFYRMISKDYTNMKKMMLMK